MNPHRLVAVASRTMALLAVAAALGAPPLTSQVPGTDPTRPDLSLGDRTSVGLTAGLAIPTGEFADLVGLGFEVTAHVLMVNEAGWLGLRVSGAGAIYREISAPVVGVGRLRLGSRMATVDIGPQVLAPRGAARPYGYATVGGTFALTDPSLDGVIGPFSDPPTYTDVTYVLKVGGGLYVPLTSGSRPISLDVGAHFRRNGDTHVLRGEGITVVQPGQLSLNPIFVNPSLLVLTLGVAVGL